MTKQGQSMIEYLAVLAVIIGAILAVVPNLKGKAKDVMNTAINRIGQ